MEVSLTNGVEVVLQVVWEIHQGVAKLGKACRGTDQVESDKWCDIFKQDLAGAILVRGGQVGGWGVAHDPGVNPWGHPSPYHPRGRWGWGVSGRPATSVAADTGGGYGGRTSVGLVRVVRRCTKSG